jgi:hypothetical protein
MASSENLQILKPKEPKPDEQMGRKSTGLEIEPRYCDVIVARWQSLTGKKAVLDGH